MKKIVVVGIAAIFLLTAITTCSVIGRKIENSTQVLTTKDSVTPVEEASHLNDPPHVEILSPIRGYIYLPGTEIFVHYYIHKWLHDRNLAVILMSIDVLVNATDNTSGIDFVELHIDDELVGTATTPEEDTEYYKIH